MSRRLWMHIYCNSSKILLLEISSCTCRCHGPVPPANPEFTLKPKKKKKTQWRNENKPGTPCVPCQEIVVKSCLGNHIGGEQSVCFYFYLFYY